MRWGFYKTHIQKCFKAALVASLILGYGSALLGQVQTLPTVEKRYALLVGVSDYDDNGISSFKDKSPENDVQRVRDVLVKRAGFLDENVYVLSSLNDDINLKPTRENVIKKLSRLENQVPPDGLFFFFFSGHGMTVESKPFLLPSNAAYFPTAKKMADLSISIDAIRDSIEQMKVSQVIILLDACRSDPQSVSKSDAPNPLTVEFKKGLDLSTLGRAISAYATFFATSEGYRAYVDDDKKQGFFSEAVIEALNGQDQTGVVTLGSLVDYVQKNVPDRVIKRFGSLAKQFPQIEYKGYLPANLQLTVASEVKAELPLAMSRRSLFVQGEIDLIAQGTRREHGFEQRGGSTNVDCEATAASSLDFTLPPGAEFIRESINARWIDRNNIKDATADFKIQGDRVTAFGTLRGLDRQLLNCPGGGHATLVVSGGYADLPPEDKRETIEVKRTSISQPLYLKYPAQSAVRTASIVLLATDDSGGTVDTLSMRLEASNRAQTTGSAQGLFMAINTGQGDIVVLPKSTISNMVDSANVVGSANVNYLPSGAPLGKVIGRLRLLDNTRRQILCTGFLVGADLIMTARACFDDIVSGDVTFGTGESSQTYNLTLPVIRVDSVAPFVVARVAGQPGQEYGTVSWAAPPPPYTKPVTLISYRGETPVSTNCEIVAAQSGGFFHNCETGPGSAGSPLFADDDKSIVGMHFERLGGRGVAVSSDSILPALKLVQQLAARPVSATPIVQTVTFESISFNTMDDDKDDDTYLYFTIRNRETGEVVASYSQMSRERFPDHSTTAKVLSGLRKVPEADLKKLQVEIRIAPTGNDTWRFGFVVKGTRSNGPNLEVSHNGIVLTQRQPLYSFGLF